MSDRPIAERRALVQRLHAEGLSQRQIAARVGCDHATVLRDLRALRATGVHQADGEPSAGIAEAVPATAAAHQNSAGAGAAGNFANFAAPEKEAAPAGFRDSRDAHQNGDDGGAGAGFVGFAGPEKRVFDRYRAAGDEAWPAWRDERQRVLREAEAERTRQATQLWARVAGYFAALPTFDQEWQPLVEADRRVPELLALRPRFPLPGDVEVYLRLGVVQGHDGVLLRGSTAGDAVWLPARSGARDIECKLGLALRFELQAAARGPR